jgi:hypothetical protein
MLGRSFGTCLRKRLLPGISMRVYEKICRMLSLTVYCERILRLPHTAGLSLVIYP